MASYVTFKDPIAMSQTRYNTLFAGLLVVMCAVGLWFAYDWFQGRYIRAFSDQTALFSGDRLSLPAELAGPGKIRLVHFWDPACPCNVGNQQHLAELIERFADRKSVGAWISIACRSPAATASCRVHCRRSGHCRACPAPNT